MGIVFNFLMMREIMKNQGLNQMGGDDSPTFGNAKSTVHVYDGNNVCFREYINMCKGANDAMMPRVLGDAPFKSQELPNARVVNWEKLDPVVNDPFSAQDYQDFNKFSNFMTDVYVHKKKPGKEDFEWCKDFGKRHKAYMPLFNSLPQLFLKKSPTCTMYFGPESWMLRKSQMVLVDPFAAK